MAVQFRIWGAFAWENQVLPQDLNPVPSREIDSKQYKAWADKENISPRSTQTIQQNIKHVNYDTFRQNIATCTNQFIKKSLNGSYVVLVQPEKSQAWTTSIAIHCGLYPTAALKLGEEGACELSYSLKVLAEEDETLYNTVSKVQHIVIVDDGSFSGTQMSNNISATGKIWSQFGNCTFHIIVPYLTETARKKILENHTKTTPVYLYALPEKMKALSEINISKAALPKLGVANGKENSTALTYFDHKIPNSMSFPDKLARGGFIPNHQPPYKPQDT